MKNTLIFLPLPRSTPPTFYPRLAPLVLTISGCGLEFRCLFSGDFWYRYIFVLLEIYKFTQTQKKGLEKNDSPSKVVTLVCNFYCSALLNTLRQSQPAEPRGKAHGEHPRDEHPKLVNAPNRKHFSNQIKLLRTITIFFWV